MEAVVSDRCASRVASNGGPGVKVYETTYFVFEVDNSGHTAQSDRVYLVHDGLEIEVSHLMTGYSLSNNVEDFRRATLEIGFGIQIRERVAAS